MASIGTPSRGSAPTRAKWTVLVYSASDNDLKAQQLANLDGAEKVGSDADMNIVAQVDEGGTKGVSRMRLSPDQKDGLHSKVDLEADAINMADPRSLSDFVKWGMDKYPADHYALIIADHGHGWQGAIDDDGAGRRMTLPQIREGLARARQDTGRPLDVLGWDACQMGGAEVADGLSRETRFMVSSEANEGARGWDYESLLGSMKADLKGGGSMTPRQVAEKMVDVAGQDKKTLPTMAAVDMSKMPAVTMAMQKFSGAIAQGKDPSSLRGVVDRTQVFRARDPRVPPLSRDLYDFASKVNEAPDVDPALREAAGDVMKAVDSAVVAEQHADHLSGAHGMSIQLDRLAPGYENNAFVQNTGWDRALSEMYGLPRWWEA